MPNEQVLEFQEILNGLSIEEGALEFKLNLLKNEPPVTLDGLMNMITAYNLEYANLISEYTRKDKSCYQEDFSENTDVNTYEQIKRSFMEHLEVYINSPTDTVGDRYTRTNEEPPTPATRPFCDGARPPQPEALEIIEQPPTPASTRPFCDGAQPGAVGIEQPRKPKVCCTIS